MFIFRTLIPYAVKIGSPFFRRVVVGMIPIGAVRKMKEVIGILHEESVFIYESKKKALTEEEDSVVRQVGKGKDILSVLCEYLDRSTLL